MAVLTRPRSWGLQKPTVGSKIDWGHALAQGLVLCLPLNEQGGYPLELVRGKQTVLGPTTGTAGWAGTRRGGGLSSKAGGYVTIGTEGTDLVFPTTAVTVMVGKRRTSGANAESAAFGFGAGVTTGVNYQCQAHVPWSDGTVYWDFGDYNTAGHRVSAAGLTIGNDDIWTFTAGRNGMTIWQNSVLRASSSTAIVRTTNTKAFQLANWNKTGSAGYTGETEARYSFLYVWNRELGGAEIRRLQVEPYAFIRPPVPRSVAYLNAAATAPRSQAVVMA